MFRLQKISNYGSGTTAVARTVLQGKPILDFLNVTDEQKAAALEILMELQRHLLKCVETRDSLAMEVEAGLTEYANKPLTFGDHTRAMSLPGVGDLRSKAETFLQSAKLAIAATGNLVQPFYGKGFSHKFHNFTKWTQTQFGPDDEFTKSIQRAQPFVARIAQMRNAVDHPDTEPGAPLVCMNFDVQEHDGAVVLVEPSWSLTGETLDPLLPAFDRIIESIICLGEQILMDIFYKLRSADILVIEAIPFDRRAPDNPIALRVTILSMPPE